MLAVELRFSSGRYHATPWNSHVNEGTVEWPPSAWRFLRALVATWHRKASNDVPENTLESLVERLASELPRFELPSASTAHTRHYMPLGRLKAGLERTGKVFDSFVQMNSGASAVICWPETTLADDEWRALAVLVSRMGYLGRAESWLEAVLLDDGGIVRRRDHPTPIVVAPLAEEALAGEDEEIVRVLCPMASEEFAVWRSSGLDAHSERRLLDKRRKATARGKDPAGVKLTKADKSAIDSTLPHSLLESLRADTGVLRKQGWVGIPGARWIAYSRPLSALLPSPDRRPMAKMSRPPTVARFAVASQVPPRLTDVVSLADRVRAALMSLSDASAVFSGKDKAGVPLRGNQHAFVFPEANAPHGRISHVTLYARMGFDESALGAIRTLRKVWGRDRHDIQLVLLGVGWPEDFAGENLDAGQCPLFMHSRVWVSRTPFVPTRHAKVTRRGEPKLDDEGLHVGGPDHDLLRLLGQAGFPRAVHLEGVDSTASHGKRIRWLQFETLRRDGDGSRGSRRGFGFSLRFSNPVRGPIALGYGAHFGLGLFIPAEVEV